MTNEEKINAIKILATRAANEALSSYSFFAIMSHMVIPGMLIAGKMRYPQQTDQALAPLLAVATVGVPILAKAYEIKKKEDALKLAAAQTASAAAQTAEAAQTAAEKAVEAAQIAAAEAVAIESPELIGDSKFHAAKSTVLEFLYTREEVDQIMSTTKLDP